MSSPSRAQTAIESTAEDAGSVAVVVVVGWDQAITRVPHRVGPLPKLMRLMAAAAFCLSARPAAAQPVAAPEATPTDAAQVSPVETLATQQGNLAERYQRLEVLMLKMAEFDAGTNPRRAALLKQALSESKDKHIRLQMETLVTRLRQQQLQRAVDDQTQVRDDLRALLELLLSENREDRLRNEQARMRRVHQGVGAHSASAARCPRAHGGRRRSAATGQGPRPSRRPHRGTGQVDRRERASRRIVRVRAGRGSG